MRELSLRFDHRMTDLDRNTAPPDFVDEALRWWRSQRDRPATLRKRQHRSVFGDHGVHELEIARYASQLIENSSRDDDHRNTAGTDIGNRRAHFRIETTIAGDGSVVVER